MKKLKEETLKSEKIFDGTMLHVYKDTVLCPNNVQSTREYVKHCTAAAILPITKEGNVVLERQYRYPMGKDLIEVPAGKSDKGETPLESAKRELKEETGYSGDFVPLGEFIPTCAYSSEIIYLFLATNLVKGENHLDKDENLIVFEKPLDEFIKMCASSEINDGKTIAIAFRYLEYKNKIKD